MKMVNPMNAKRQQTQPKPAPALMTAGNELLQRKSGCGNHTSGGECPECAKKKGSLQRKASGHFDEIEIPPIVYDVLRSPGQPLDSFARSFMEPRFGHDFSRVRVHTDAKAAESARAVNALAYTVGRNMVFGAGQFAPFTEAGRKLLSHELTHTIQQAAFTSAAISPREPISIEPAESALERTAEKNASRPTNNLEALAPSPSIALQRAPDEETEIQSYVFAGDKKLATDKDFARKSGRDISARIVTTGKLTKDLGLELEGMLKFFQGEAKAIYIQETQVALAQVTAGTGQKSGPKFSDYNAAVGKFVNNPNYIDNDIKKVSFFTAELAQIYYRDGSMLELGLVPKWMKPPFVEVDYHTPKEDIRPMVNPTTGDVGFFLEQELADVPGSMPYREMQQRFLHPIQFAVVSPSGRIVPTRVNMLTAPTLCRVLLDQERQFVEQTEIVAEMGEKVAGILGWWAGAGGGWAKGPGTLVKRIGPRVAVRTTMSLSPAARKLALEMDNLIARGGSKTITVEGVVFEDVQIARQGSRLAVRRFRIARVNAPPGHGDIMRMAFDQAAVATARRYGLKTVSIDVGVIINPGWIEFMKDAGYKYIQTEGAWIKTIAL
jgi:hypothetical protein